MKKKLLIISDITDKQTNGVKRTLNKTAEILSKEFDVYWINPDFFKSVSLPFYKEIDVSLNLWKIKYFIERVSPEYIHIATEGPVGLSAKIYCDKKGYNYTTSYHSMFPEFISNMFKIPPKLTYWYFRWFHSKSKNVFVPTNIVKELLQLKGFNNLVVWKRGVDKKQFNSSSRGRIENSHLKIILCVSRISKEKGLDDFCKIKLPENYLKVLVGDGPYLQHLMEKYKEENIAFVGKKTGEGLTRQYANADLFVFPSKTDTFGLTQLESISCGTPVMAYKGTASEEIIKHNITGLLVDEFNLKHIEKLLTFDRKEVETQSLEWKWEKCSQTFSDNLKTK